jgi:hypothetical protein
VFLPRHIQQYDDAVRVEQAEHLLVSYPCVYDTRQRRITAVDGTGPSSTIASRWSN